MKSYLGKTSFEYTDSDGDVQVASMPRGIRNNNPGNLVKTAINWKGKVPHSQNPDDRFEQFVELRYGIRAMMRDIYSDYNKGLNSIEALIHVYAPAFENNTKAYIANVAKALGITGQQKFDLTEESMLILCKAIVIVENGALPEKTLLNDDDYEAALKILGLNLKKKTLCCKCCGQALPPQA